MLTFRLRNNQQACRGPLLPDHKSNRARLLRRCHGEDQSVLAAATRHLVHLVLLQRAVPKPPDALAHVCVAQLAHKHRVLSRCHRFVLKLCNDPNVLCGGSRS